MIFQPNNFSEYSIMILMKLFMMKRNNIVVAHCVQFVNGKCVVYWLGEHSSIVIWDSLESLIAVSCTNQHTEFVLC
jgi:hypothetical protein